MRCIQAADRIIEHEKSKLLVGRLGHGQEQSKPKRVEVGLRKHTIRRPLAEPVEVERELYAFVVERIHRYPADVLGRMQMRVQLPDATRDAIEATLEPLAERCIESVVVGCRVVRSLTRPLSITPGRIPAPCRVSDRNDFC